MKKYNDVLGGIGRNQMAPCAHGQIHVLFGVTVPPMGDRLVRYY